MKISDVKLDGRTFQDAAIEFLDNAPSDEVFTLAELAGLIQRKVPTSHYGMGKLKDYSVMGTVDTRRRLLFGGPAALKALRKKLQTL